VTFGKRIGESWSRCRAGAIGGLAPALTLFPRPGDHGLV